MTTLKSAKNDLVRAPAAKFLSDKTKQLTVEEAKCFTKEILINERSTKLNLMLMMHKRGFAVLGYKDFKSYVTKELPMTYDAVIKQMVAAEVAAELFGLEYVGFYSDSAMRTLRALGFKNQIRIVCHLKKKLNKKIDENFTQIELTKKAIEVALVELSGGEKNLIKQLNSKLPAEDSEPNYHEFPYDNLAIFEPYVEEEYIQLHGFSRWDERSLPLLKRDELLEHEEKYLDDILQVKWSLSDMLNHVQSYHPLKFDEMKHKCMQGHHMASDFLVSIYFPDIPDIPDIPDGEEDCSLDDILGGDFFSDAGDKKVKREYGEMRKKIKKSLIHKIYNIFQRKNPKAAVLMAIADELDLEELNDAQAYLSLLYDDRLEGSDDDDGFDLQGDE
ncbi:hypothetical protein FM038_003375 [Shewanella eurypsychrophilus]|uniref:Initiator Rep protein domain-containing protein n=1 Tax=Shewanella eurypsychrophilus TaxID=2593656 RepID=A0ABX6V2G8_9GAMM|nr:MULTISPECIES: hypothetical protein [Shewanella]QFU21280.1 hypothetical protein FS418_04955 [Shewanella sp. YLB-09]QPG56571.1 hypothetical protein FM038_003375 [Shewanella eurypsychrophilus]